MTKSKTSSKPGAVKSGGKPPIRVVTYDGPGTKPQMREVPWPKVPPKAALIKIGACGVCGTDQHILKGHWPKPLPWPFTLGHEMAGVIVEIGAELKTDFMGKLFTGRESVRENVGGPIMIAQQSRQAAERGGASFWSFVAILSVALAVFNILPIPALDGGHLVFLLYEAVARREPSLKVRMVVQQIGFVLILALMVFAVFNDVSRWIG